MYAPLHSYPQRADRAAQSALSLPRWLAHQAADLSARLAGPGTQAQHLMRHAVLAQAVHQALDRLPTAPPTPREADAQALALQHLRTQLRQHGFTPALRRQALTTVAAAGQAALGRRPYPTQLFAAAVILDGGLAEMATGEGKTYAAALGAACWALAGVPVHLMTANDYLVQRDAEALAPLYHALGLRLGCVLAGSTPAERRRAYACDVTYCTARETAFDYLRDAHDGSAFAAPLQRRADSLAVCGTGLAAALSPAENRRGHGHSHSPGDPALPSQAPPATPLLRGLHMAVIDEADSLLIDEAALPLLLSTAADAPQQRRSAPQQRALAFQSLGLARQLVAGQHFDIERRTRQVRWRPGAADHIEQLAAGLGGVWFNRRHRQDLLATAVHALHGLRAERDYLVRDGRVLLLDAVTGRVAEGRQWSGHLHALVELKEGCTLTPATRVAARLSLQRFFARYLHLAGMSGTLHECRTELRRAYGLPVLRVPLRLPSQARHGPDQLFADAATRQAAAVQAVAARHAAGQPVLVGTDSVAASQALSQALTDAGVPHQRLDARHDAHEAAVVAQAGQPGAVTVATHMAGRGTDIALGAGVAAAGGLHVLVCQDNPSARLDRQLMGRSARAGQPGSAACWRSLDAAVWLPGPGLGGGVDRLLRPLLLAHARSSWPLAGRKPGSGSVVQAWTRVASAWLAWRQRRAEAEQARRRHQLVEQDLEWQHQSGKAPGP